MHIFSSSEIRNHIPDNTGQSPAPDGTGQGWLTWFLKGILVLAFFILVARLFELQIIKGAYFRSLAEGNRIRRVSIKAMRGKIVARGGETLVGSREVKKRLVFHPDVGYEITSDIAKAKEDELISEPVRDYRLGSNFAHVSGYLGEVNENEIGKVNPECQEKGPRLLGSWLGRSGLEGFYECELSGINGEELVEVDSAGNKIRTLGHREPIPGKDIITTIYFGLQQKVSQLMQGKNGSVVVTDAQGQVLALYSSPSYDPNIFVSPDNADKVKTILTDDNKPLFNRSISGRFQPGSIFKPVIAIAALEEAKINEKYFYEDVGQIIIESIYGKFSYKNWYFTQYGGVEGKINVVRAITRSTDTFFYEIGGKLGVEAIDIWAGKFGLNNQTGIDLPGEVAGLVPSPEWKERNKGEKWFLGNTYHLSIGQGDIAVTPLGINMAISAIANGGELCQPYVVDERQLKSFQFLTKTSSGKVSPAKQDFTWQSNFRCQDLGISEKSLELVKEGMVGACSDGGTGYTFFDVNRGNLANGGKVACKTGTAEVGDGSQDAHAWFVFFAPSFTKVTEGGLIDKPEIVVTVLVERGGEGSSIAGPIAREIFDYWFGEKENGSIENGI